MSVWSTSTLPMLYRPTAQQSDAEVHVTPQRKLCSVALVLGELTMDHAGPVGASGMLDAGAAALPFNGTAWLSTKAEATAELAEGVFIPCGGFAAKLSIASRTPTEPRAKAGKMRGLKKPD
jgi:hypothetical protein